MSHYLDPKPLETPTPEQSLPGVIHSGKLLYGSGDYLRSNGVPEGDIAAAVTLRETLDFKAAVRKDIERQVGDTETILGSVSDGMTVLLAGLSTLMHSINTRATLAEVKADIQEFMPVVDTFNAGLAAGTVKLPHRAKGAETAIAETLQRITGVAEVYETRKQSMKK